MWKLFIVNSSLKWYNYISVYLSFFSDHYMSTTHLLSSEILTRPAIPRARSIWPSGLPLCVLKMLSSHRFAVVLRPNLKGFILIWWSTKISHKVIVGYLPYSAWEPPYIPYFWCTLVHFSKMSSFLSCLSPFSKCSLLLDVKRRESPSPQGGSRAASEIQRRTNFSIKKTV